MKKKFNLSPDEGKNVSFGLLFIKNKKDRTKLEIWSLDEKILGTKRVEKTYLETERGIHSFT